MALRTQGFVVRITKSNWGHILTFDIPASGGRGSCNHCPQVLPPRPKTTRAFWDRKREDNMARDRHVTRQLRGRGWKVIRIWQHSLKKSPNACLTRIRHALAFLRYTDSEVT